LLLCFFGACGSPLLLLPLRQLLPQVRWCLRVLMSAGS
jgi:hypothetical protein